MPLSSIKFLIANRNDVGEMSIEQGSRRALVFWDWGSGDSGEEWSDKERLRCFETGSACML